MTPENRRPLLRCIVKRALLSLAVFITLVGLFYTVENWRGKRAWDKYKSECEAQGFSLDWKTYIPPAVPDDQNFFGAPNMQQWFTGRGATPFSHRLEYQHIDEFLLQRRIGAFAEITIVPLDAPVAPDSADIVLYYDAPHLTLQNQPTSAISKKVKPTDTSGEHVKADANTTKALQELIKPKIDAVNQTNTQPWLHEIVSPPIGLAPLDKVAPLRVTIHAKKITTLIEAGELFGTTPVPGVGYIASGHTAISTGSNTFLVELAPPPYITAEDFLAWTASFQDDFSAIGEALKRPYSRMAGDYEHPFNIPIPNFVTLRLTAQILAKKVQSRLLLGQSDKALANLTILHELTHVCDGKPTGKPMTLIAGMINVAVKGLYVETIGDGLRLHMWKDSQLAEIQKQLASVDLAPMVHAAFQFEVIAIAQIPDDGSGAAGSAMFDMKDKSLREKAKDRSYLFYKLAPRGWIYQNALTSSFLKKMAEVDFDLTNHLIFPSNAENQYKLIVKELDGFSPYTYLGNQWIPNVSRAVQTLAKNQTLVNEAYVVCALERYRLVRGHYPENLDALIPQFMEKIPNDVIGGAPLKYRLDGEKFVLYSIGWNEKDDGGIQGLSTVNNADLTKNDWVWPYEDVSVK